MIVYIQVRDAGPFAVDARDGDPFQVTNDATIPGTQDLKNYLVVKMPDPPGFNSDAPGENEIVQPEYAPGPYADNNTIRRFRRYSIPWRHKFTEQERTAILDPLVSVPLVEGKFTLADIVQKN